MGNIHLLLSNFIELIKNKGLILLQLFFVFLLPIKALILLVGLMIFFDTFTGLWKAKKNKERITSHKLSRVVGKMFLYQTALITFFVLDKYMLGEFISIFSSIDFFLTKFIAIFFCTIELLSINENLESIWGINFFKKMKTFLLSSKRFKREME